MPNSTVPHRPGWSLLLNYVNGLRVCWWVGRFPSQIESTFRCVLWVQLNLTWRWSMVLPCNLRPTMGLLCWSSWLSRLIYHPSPLCNLAVYRLDPHWACSLGRRLVVCISVPKWKRFIDLPLTHTPLKTKNSHASGLIKFTRILSIQIQCGKPKHAQIKALWFF